MKHLLIIAALITLTSCSTESKKTNQIESLAHNQRIEFVSNLIRHIGKLPSQATPKTKFHSMFDSHYEKLVADHRLESYYKELNGREYFLITRTAPSIHVKRVAIGGYVSFNESGEITELNEVFRTWKKTPEDLKPVAELLFLKMINAEDLTPYYTENSGNEEIIEFPNQEAYYDTLNFTWVSLRENPMEELIQQKYEKLEQAMDKIDSTLTNDSIN